MTLIKLTLGAALGLSLSFSASANNLYNELVYLQKNHPLLQSAYANTQSAQQNLLAAKGGRTPVVNFSVQAGYEHQTRPNSVRTSEDTESASLSVTQLLWDSGVVGNAIKAAKARVSAADYSVNLTSQDLLQAGIQTYFGLVLAEQRLVHALESVSRISDQKQTEAKKMKRGKGSKADFLQAQSQLLAAQARVATEEGSLQIARNAYVQVFGKQAPLFTSMLKQATPSQALPLTLQDAESIALGNAPVLKAANAAVKAALKDFKSVKGSFYPRFDLVAEGDYRDDAQAVLNTVTEGRLFVRMNYDFDLGFSRRGVVGAARAAQQSAHFEAENQRRVVIESVRSAWQRYLTAKKNYDLSRLQLESATEFLSLAIQERKRGKRTLQDILNGELVRLSAKTRLATASSSLSTSAFDILRATGQLSIESL